MNKKLLASTMGLAFVAMGATSTASAALATDATLTMDTYVLGGYYGNLVVGGSYFAMDNGGVAGVFEKSERTGLTGNNGIQLGSDQSDLGNIDVTWNFFQNPGNHVQAGTLSVSSDDGAGNATINMSGWTVMWGAPQGAINMGTGADAIVTCANTCEVGDTYTLDYTAVVPDGGFAGVPYQLHLEGTIAAAASAVPVPAAVWLFGSGLVGLAGVARRRKAA